MLNTKFQGHWSVGSDKDFLRLLQYIGMAVMLAMRPRPFEPALEDVYEIWSQSRSRLKLWMDGRRTDDERRSLPLI